MAKPVHVLHSVSAMNMGGIENFVMNLYRSVDRSVIQFDFVYAVDEPCLFDDEIKSLGGRIFKFQSPNKHPLAAGRFYNAIFNEHPEIKVLHGHLSDLTGNLGVFGSAKRNGIAKRAIHSHSSSTSISNGLEGLIMLFNARRNVKRIENLATDYFACSDKASNCMFPNAAERGLNVRLINNGIDVNRFIYDENKRLTVRKQLGISPDTLVIGNVARLVQVKNQAFLLEILKYLIDKVDVALLIVGDGPLRQSLEKEAQELGVSDRVYFTGRQNDSAPYYSAMDLYCMPSIYEGLPVSCVEAQCNGLPLLLSDAVSRNSSYTKNVIFKSLSCSAFEWGDVAASLMNLPITRFNGKDATVHAGFDINETAHLLQDYYLS